MAAAFFHLGPDWSSDCHCKRSREPPPQAIGYISTHIETWHGARTVCATPSPNGNSHTFENFWCH